MKPACRSCSHCSDAPENFGPSAQHPVVALAGNPNTGKTTLFNALTGNSQHTGNWPGKTVLRTTGTFAFAGKTFTVVDLPGTYSLHSNSADEQAARDFLILGRPDVTVTVVDASCLERNLNLVLQVLEITSRAVVCVNLIDEAARKRITVDLRRLSAELGVPVAGTAARTRKGIPELVRAIDGVWTGRIIPSPKPVVYDEEIEAAVKKMEPELRPLVPQGVAPRWMALRLLERDESALRMLREHGVTPAQTEAGGLTDASV